MVMVHHSVRAIVGSVADVLPGGPDDSCNEGSHDTTQEDADEHYVDKLPLWPVHGVGQEPCVTVVAVVFTLDTNHTALVFGDLDRLVARRAGDGAEDHRRLLTATTGGGRGDIAQYKVIKVDEELKLMMLVGQNLKRDRHRDVVELNDLVFVVIYEVVAVATHSLPISKMNSSAADDLIAVNIDQDELCF